ncbi:MAG: DUF2726 domain-containing protein [Planctomycetaceae bacterium]|nr:DUF2726 domain-containing protein [Planctomycetales bacterium]MCB9924570.1 DUF2726 domain-containing protein [Planctomycetaceae bacterium]
MPAQRHEQTGKQRSPFPYGRRRYLLSIAERRFFATLLKAAPPGVAIFSKVRLADLVFVRKEAEGNKTHFNRIQAKHIDFVICDIATSAVQLAIELDDKSHSRDDRKRRDAFVDDLLKHVHIPLLRFRAKDRYNAAAIAMKLKAVIGRRT